MRYCAWAAVAGGTMLQEIYGLRPRVRDEKRFCRSNFSVFSNGFSRKCKLDHNIVNRKKKIK